MAKKVKAPNTKPEQPARPDRSVAKLEESLHRLFGKTKGSDFEHLIPRLAAHNDSIQSWLSASRENTETFEHDPVAALRKNFPELKIPATASSQHKIGLGENIRIGGGAFAAPDPAVLALFVAVWNYLATSEENVTGFRANPIGVITSLGQGQPPIVVSTVMKAFGVSLDDGIAFGRFIHEAVEQGILNPGGPVQAAVIEEIAVLNDTAILRGT